MNVNMEVIYKIIFINDWKVNDLDILLTNFSNLLKMPKIAFIALR